MINSAFDFISTTDLNELVTSQRGESKTLEYKRDFLAETSDDKRKILRTVSAFANTSGGDLVYGIDAVDGVATNLTGLSISDEDGFRLRLENSIRDGIQPRIPRLQIKFIPVNGDKKVVVVRVEKSWNAPHRLVQDGHFYARNSAGTYALDVGELRQAFSLSETVVERIRSFLALRVSKIQNNRGAVPLVEGVRVVFEMIPISAFSAVPPQRIELTSDQRNGFQPMGTSSTHSRVNLDGFYSYAFGSGDATKTYVQVFRNGVVEVVASFGPIEGEAEKPVPATYIETQLIRLVGSYRRGLFSAGIEGPFMFFLAILNVTGSKLLTGGAWSETASLAQNDADDLVLSEVVAESNDFDVAQTLRPLFDSYWNAYGYEKSQNYDKHGLWKPVRG